MSVAKPGDFVPLIVAPEGQNGQWADFPIDQGVGQLSVRPTNRGGR